MSESMQSEEINRLAKEIWDRGVPGLNWGHVDDQTREVYKDIACFIISREAVLREVCDAAKKYLIESEAREYGLLQALIKYGEHRAGCKENSKFEPCVCGLDNIFSLPGQGGNHEII